MAERITARVRASAKEALEATSPQRPTVNRPEVIDKLKCTAWLGIVVAIQVLLQLVKNMSLTMKTVNAMPLELMQEQRELYDKLVLIEAVFGIDQRTRNLDGAQYPQVPFLQPSSISSTRSRILRISMGCRELRCCWRGLTWAKH